MNEREYWALRAQEFSVLTGEPPTMPDLCRHLYSGAEDELVRPEARRLIDDAKAAGIPVGALTNDLTSFHDAEWLARMGVIRDFDVLVDGRTEGVYKPDPAAYRIILDRMGVPGRGHGLHRRPAREPAWCGRGGPHTCALGPHGPSPRV